MTDNRYIIEIIQETRRLLSFHNTMGIKSYPATDGIKSFLATTSPPVTNKANTSKKAPSPSSTTNTPVKKSAPPAMETNDSNLEVIRTDLGNCERCGLNDKRTTIIFGSGPAKADLFIIGEWPDSDEDREGNPFQGVIGELLDRMLKAINMTRDQVYLANIVKCHPGQDNTPNDNEIAACRPFLLRQIATVNPKVILTMGLTASQTLIKSKEPLSRLRGRLHTFHGIDLMATYHPGYLINNQEMKKATWLDLQMVQKRCASAK